MECEAPYLVDRLSCNAKTLSPQFFDISPSLEAGHIRKGNSEAPRELIARHRLGL